MRVPNLKSCSLALAILILGTFADTRLAEAGVIKITQAKALAGAVTPGDAPGFPVTISRSGSFALDSNLTVPINKDGIHITASQVNLDLMGFTIQGSGGNTGSGIIAYKTIDNITIANGFISGMGEQGIWIAGFAARVEGITASNNEGVGIVLGNRAAVTNSNSSNNGEFGIMVGTNSSITDSNVSENDFDGIHAFGGTIARNTIAENGAVGVVLQGNNALVISNTIERNGGLGMQFGVNQGGGYRDNVINNNLGGTVFGGKNMGGNLCNQGTACP